uniref:Uncharacterized protein n=1 Tax=Glossina pallidipes TaxID=7398 RepID=A0A1A9ZG75_GLOPL
MQVDSLFFPLVKDFKHQLFSPYGRESDYNHYNTQYGYPYGSSYRNSPTTQYYPNNGGSSKRGGRTYSDIARVRRKIAILMLIEVVNEFVRRRCPRSSILFDAKPVIILKTNGVAVGDSLEIVASTS